MPADDPSDDALVVFAEGLLGDLARSIGRDDLREAINDNHRLWVLLYRMSRGDDLADFEAFP